MNAVHVAIAAPKNDLRFEGIQEKRIRAHCRGIGLGRAGRDSQILLTTLKLFGWWLLRLYLRYPSVRLGSPVGVRLEDGTLLKPGDAEEGTFRCPVQILGLDHDETVYAPFGEDPFVALQYALDLIGDLLKKGSDRLSLENRHLVPPPTRDHWIWRYSD